MFDFLLSSRVLQQECPVSFETELWVKFAPIGVLLFLLGFVVGFAGLWKQEQDR